MFTNPNVLERPLAKCSECDRETRYYNRLISPDNSSRVVCWQCQMRSEKGFNTKPGFRRMARQGFIPR